MQATQYFDVNELLQLLLSDIQKVLGKKLVGLYLYGSLAWGDFDHETSDIDLLAAISTDINNQELANLKIMHEDFINKYKQWNDRIEVQYLSLPALKTFKSKTSKVATISPGEPLHIINMGRHWLMNWYMVRVKGIVLFGPDPKTIIEPVSKEEFIESVKDHVRSWDEWVGNTHSKGAQAYAILTMCRAFYAIKRGEQASKKQAALWTTKQLPNWSALIKNAISWRKEIKNKQAESESTYPETLKFVNYVRDKILDE